LEAFKQTAAFNDVGASLQRSHVDLVINFNMALFETSSFVAYATFVGAVIALIMTAFMWS